ncbi:MAG: hypothetical protein ABI777_09080, partial [Betaproteobacteria bacterium]
LADRRNRRRIWLALASVLLVGALAATKGLVGYYLVGNRAATIEVTLGIASILAIGLAFGQRRIERALDARFNRNTHAHRTALAALADEIAVCDDHRELERAVVNRFDALFGTRGSALYRRDEQGDFVCVAANDTRYPAHVAANDDVVTRLLASHAPVAAAELPTSLNAPMVWPLRMRGQLCGFLAAGEHVYIESFDLEEIDGVTELATATAVTLAMLDPARPASAPPPHPSLPLQLSTFLGRDDAVVDIKTILRTTRLLTVTGPVGIGKSRLALVVAGAVADDFHGGVHWIDLGACARADDIAPTIARGVGLDGNGVADLPVALRAHLGGNATLLIMDGCESVHDTCADVTGALLAGAPALVIIATSQQALGLPGEREYPLAPLATGAVGLADADAVQLFVDRARAVQPTFAPDPQTRGVIAEICAVLDGMPLAIEIAAARMKYFDAATIRAGLETYADALPRDVAIAPHTRSLQASLAASFAHLTADERMAAHRLAQLDPTFSLATATRAAFNGDTAWAQATIIELIDKSWLCRIEDRSSPLGPGFRMLAPLRRYALASASRATAHASGILDAAGAPPPGEQASG